MKIVTDLSITSAPHRARRGWHPGKLFQTGAKGAWFDPSDLTTLFQDVAGTLPVVSDGDPVALMLDKSSNQIHMVQPATALRPLFRSANGRHWLEFDGVDDRLTAPGLTYTRATFGAAVAMKYLGMGSRFGAAKARTVSGVFFGLSHPSVSGPISNTGGQQVLNGSPAPANRTTLRASIQQSSVLGAYEVSASSFSGFEWQTVGHSTGAPDPAAFYGYIEIDGMDATQMSAAVDWLAGKAGIQL